MTSLPERDSTAADASSPPVEPAVTDVPPAAWPADAAPVPAAAATGDALPEAEPLTPELVEEEAIRGDIVMRGAVVLLALLFGWTKLTESGVLTRIRTGEYLTSHGLLPPRTDVFTVTAKDHAWINLGWLGDIIVSVVHRIGGDWALTIWTALLSALAFWLLGRTSRTGAPTWWSSIVLAIAVVAAFPWLIPGPEIVTILGTAWLMWSLNRAEAKADSRLWLRLAPVFWLWSNCDPNAWLGLAILWAYALGRWLKPTAVEPGSLFDARNLVKAAAASTVAALIHPFHYHVLEAPYVQYAVVYPEIREYLGLSSLFSWMWWPIWDAAFWSRRDPFAIAALVTAGVSLLAMLLNLKRLNLGLALVWIVANAAGAAAGHLLPVVALVNAVVAGLSGQAWYAATFRQTYTIDLGELIFSRVGRAITVLGLFAVAYLMINGILPGADGRRIGLGFDWRISTAVASYQKLVADSVDDRPLNTRVEHGDLLIWVGQKPFVDSRIALFAQGPSNLLATHRATVRALMPPIEEVKDSGRPDIWKATFDKYGITHMYVRLTGDDIARKYVLLLRMFSNPDLQMTRLGAAAAEFYRFDVLDPALRAHIEKQPGTAFIKQAFNSEDTPPLPGEPAWPRELTTYDRWLIQPEPVMPEDAQLSEHYAVLSDELPPRMTMAQLPGETGIALKYLAIRHARRALRDDVSNPRTYRVLMQTYNGILPLERGLMQQLGLPYQGDLRSTELVVSAYCALMTSTNKAFDHEALAKILVGMNYYDVARDQLKKVHELTGAWSAVAGNDEASKELRQANRELYTQLNDTVLEVEENLKAELNKGTDPLAIAQGAVQAGCPGLALKTLMEKETDLSGDPVATLMICQTMIAAGRIEEAWERLESSESLFRRNPELHSLWRMTTASVNASQGNYQRASKLLSEDSAEMVKTRMLSILDGAPLMSAASLKEDLMSVARPRLAMDVLFTFPERWGLAEYTRALCELEPGRLSVARELLHSVLENTPDASIRPLAVFYDFMLTGERKPIEGPERQIPIWGEMFAEEPAPAEAPAAPTANPAAESPVAPAAETPAAPAADPGSEPAATPAAPPAAPETPAPTDETK